MNNAEAVEYIQQVFNMPSFSMAWDTIDQMYRGKKLGEDMTDDERVAEYANVNQQLRKYISSRQEQVMRHQSNFPAMLDEVAAIIAKADEYAPTRQQLMYNFMRDSWLIGLYNAILTVMMDDIEGTEVE